jgi:hypothetical protein
MPELDRRRMAVCVVQHPDGAHSVGRGDLVRALHGHLIGILPWSADAVRSLRSPSGPTGSGRLGRSRRRRDPLWLAAEHLAVETLASARSSIAHGTTTNRQTGGERAQR